MQIVLVCVFESATCVEWNLDCVLTIFTIFKIQNVFIACFSKYVFFSYSPGYTINIFVEMFHSEKQFDELEIFDGTQSLYFYTVFNPKWM